MYMKPFYLILTCLAVLCMPLAAQEKKAPSRIDVSLFAFEYAPGYKTIYLESSPGNYDEIRLSSANILGPFKTLVSEAGEVYLRTLTYNEEGVAQYPVIGVVRVSGSVRAPILVLVPISSGDRAYAGLVLDASQLDFPGGSYKLINFSRKDIRALIGKTPVRSAPASITSFDTSSEEDRLMSVHFQYKGDDKWQTFGRTTWVKDENGRKILCAFFDDKTQRMKIRGIPLR